MIAAGCTGRAKPIPPPPTTAVSVTKPPDPPNLSDVTLQSAAGRTTTTKVALTPGEASIAGQVVGPEGPVAGATVLVERLVDDAVGSMEVVTAEDGTWKAPSPPPPPPPVDPNAPPTAPPRPTTTQLQPGPQGLLGGRYRVRAWRTPDLALTAPTVLFLNGTEQKQLPLQVSRFSGLAVTSSLAPSPPVVEEPANLAALVTTRSVDPDGIVRSLGVPGATVALAAGSGWEIQKTVPETDGSGKAVFQLRCRAEGPQPLALSVNGTTSFTLSVPACVLPPPSTTAVEPAPGETTTTFEDPGGPTTTARAGPTTTRFSTSTSRSTSTTR